MAQTAATGSTTQQVYTFIQEQKYKEAIQILTRLKSQFPQSRAANSLLAYCYFCSEEYDLAAEYYENLAMQYPSIKNYRLSFLQALYKSGKIDEAERQCFASRMMEKDSAEAFANQLYLLLAIIKYDKDDLPGAQNIITEHCNPADQDVKVLEAAIVFKQGRFEEARDMLINTISTSGYQPHIAYNIALCHYMLKQYVMALKSIDDIQEKANREYQDAHGYFNSQTDSIPFDPAFLKDSMLIEALNLKAAIEFQLHDTEKAKMALEEMPTREEYQLDQVTLHNTAILSVEDDTEAAADKLFFLLSKPPFPRETLGNLLLMLCKLGDYQKASELLQAEKTSSAKISGTTGKMIGVVPVPVRQGGRLKTGLVPSTALRTAGGIASTPLGAPPKTAMEAAVLSGNVSLKGSSLSDQLRDFVTASILMQTPGIESKGIEAFRAFHALAVKQLDDVQKASRQLHELRQRSTDEQLRLAYHTQEDCIQRYTPTMMSMAKIFWDQKKYAQTATVLMQCKDVCGEKTEWKLNMAHTYFMQEQYNDAIDMYNQIVDIQGKVSILDVTPVVLANLCVCYVMNENNTAGEDIIMKVDHEEKEMLASNPDRQDLHQCVIDLVVGTLYCSRRTFDFGINRTIKSFEPVEKKLSPGTWYYAKRNFVFLCETIAKFLGNLKEDQQQQVLHFLDMVDEYGKDMLAENSDTAAAEIYEGEFPSKEKNEKKTDSSSSATSSYHKPDKKKDRNSGKDKPGTAASEAPQVPLTVSDEARLIKKVLLSLWALT